MKIKIAVRLVLSLLPAIAGGGCATHALWTKADLDNCNIPAGKVNLRLFTTHSDSEVVVVYDEYSERHDSTRTRAYLLRENESRIEQRHPPMFVKTNSFTDLRPVPIFLSTNGGPIVSSQPVYAVFSTNSQSFTLSSDGKVTGPYELPVYDDGKGKAERLALTPLAATADLTIVGGILGYYFVVYASSFGGR
ncbi:MAG TPA: hypothetical protein VH595_17315 [Verrucomicrobiae bacterium]|jgi:hypothetical protein|nr:hypothetical protein [Verrucomicrobiae bacterium]